MEEKRPVDLSGALLLIGFASLLAFNQVVVKVTAGGFAPVFQAGLRSVLALVVLAIWMWARQVRFAVPAGAWGWGILAGVVFSLEFMALFTALDLTTVSRASVIFYSMPVWLALASHLLLPGERLTGPRILGLVMAMAGVALALSDRSNGTASLLGDLLALAGAMLWAAIALILRMTPLSSARSETQLVFQLSVSGVVLLALAPLFGPMVRDFAPVYVASLLFQAIFVASLGFLLWFRLIKIYRASDVASFSFLSPVLAVVLGWALLGERIGWQVWLALVLVASGIVLINRR